MQTLLWDYTKFIINIFWEMRKHEAISRPPLLHRNKHISCTTSSTTDPKQDILWNSVLDIVTELTQCSVTKTSQKPSIATKVTDDSCAWRIQSSVPFHCYKYAWPSRSLLASVTDKASHRTYHVELSPVPYHYEESYAYKHTHSVTAPKFLKMGINYLNLSSFGQFRQYRTKSLLQSFII